MIGDVLDPRIAVAIGESFGSASDAVRQRAGRSLQREEQGQRATYEPVHTEDLIDAMGSAIRDRVRAAQEVLGNQVQLSVEFEPVNLPVGEEAHYGADIGVRVTITTPGFTVRKACLLQAKRMYGPVSNPRFPEIEGRGEDQAVKMLSVTPASFFLLYSFLPQTDLLTMASVPVSMLCPYNGASPPMPPSSCPVWAGSAGSLWDLGVAVLPAARVYGVSTACRQAQTRYPVDAAKVLAGCLPLGVFFADLFGACFVGDVRPDVVRIATPPSLRDPIGAVRPKFEDFWVRRVMDIKMQIQ